jgi:pyruvate kinase
MKEITDLSEQFVIFNIYNQADMNEISFISNTADTEKISKELNLKKDITVKAETDTTDSVSEYTKVIIIYKD